MRLFGPAHLLALALTIAVPVLLSVVTVRNRSPERAATWIAWALTTVLIANWLGVAAVYAPHRHWTQLLPMHLCDWATGVVILALLTRRQFYYDLAYFWGFAGTLQAILTPDLPRDVLPFRVITFFVAHSGIIAGVLFLTWGMKMRPAFPRSLLRAFGWIQVYCAAAMLVNWIAGTNYGYLAAKPKAASLLDYLAPWPWYILQMELLAALSFLLYYAPFTLRRARTATITTSPR
jgi:hypothetical integral membrane protein (TIGR02206 family)